MVKASLININYATRGSFNGFNQINYYYYYYTSSSVFCLTNWLQSIHCLKFMNINYFTLLDWEGFYQSRWEIIVIIIIIIIPSSGFGGCKAYADWTSWILISLRCRTHKVSTQRKCVLINIHELCFRRSRVRNLVGTEHISSCSYGGAFSAERCWWVARFERIQERNGTGYWSGAGSCERWRDVAAAGWGFCHRERVLHRGHDHTLRREVTIMLPKYKP